MIQEKTIQIAVIGGGAAGLAAAAECAASGVSVLVIDREEIPGGILRQCIHNGFGLHCFKEELTGPEYADRVMKQAQNAGAGFCCNTSVTDIVRNPDGSFTLLLLSPETGVTRLHASAVILAMGCRERNRGNLAVPGSRPAGVFTAGCAQKLLNIEGMLPGKCAVIVGSGDIGLIMARRLRWSGVEVKAVVEIMPHPSGITRNVVQCLEDFNIPLYLEHAVVSINGRERVRSVDVAPLSEGIPQLEQKFNIPCDTVLFSVGLIPENELALKLGVELNPATGGAVVDADYCTNIPGVFAGGNVLHVHDLVDFVSEESARAAQAAVRYLKGAEKAERNPVKVSANLKYAVPNFYTAGKTTVFAFRPLVVCEAAELVAELNGEKVWKRRFFHIRPAEMLMVELDGEVLNAAGTLEFKLIPGHKEVKK
jgi:thioredoxin reductase